MFNWLKKMNDIFGFPLAIIGIICAVMFFWYEKKPEITYQILSESNVLDVKEKIGKLSIFFDHEEIYKNKKNLYILTMRIINSGRINILASYFDVDDYWGFKVQNGHVIEAQLLSSSSDYLKAKVNPKINSDTTVNFNKVFFDENENFVIKALVLYEMDKPIQIVPVGKIAGIDRIKIQKIYSKEDVAPFWGQVFSGGTYVQIVRTFFYTLIFYFFVIVLVAVIVTPAKYKKIRLYQKMGQTKGNLGSLKSAMAIYYGDHEGEWPSNLEMLVPKYLNHIPSESIKGSNRVVQNYDGNGGWVYKKEDGKIFVNVEGKDIKGFEYVKYGTEDDS